MSFSIAMSVAATGIQQNIQQLDDSARRLADPLHDANRFRELVSVVQAKHGVAANAAVVRTTDKMVGSLVDMLV